MTHENAENKIVSSKKIGTNAGTVAQLVGLPWTTSLYSSNDGYASSTTAVSNPVRPPHSTTALSQDLPSPIAASMPCTGNGVCTSHFLKPASRIFSAALKSAAAVGNSAAIP